MTETYPYPKRPSEITTKEELVGGAEPLDLTKEEREALKGWEQPFFDEVKRLKELSIRGQDVFIEAFLDDEGERLFSALYLDTDILTTLKGLGEEAGISFDGREGADRQKEFSDAFMKDMLAVVENEEKYNQYVSEGVNFENLQNYLGNKEAVLLKGSPARLYQDEDMTHEERLALVEKLYQEADIKDMSEQVRKRVETYTREWAKEKFKKDFLEANGEVEQMEDPLRIGRVVDLDEIFEKVGGLREFKAALKSERRDLDDTDLGKAKGIVLDIYQRYINILLASDYYVGRLLSQNLEVDTARKKKALDLIRGVTFEEEGRFESGKLPRVLERIDHFIKGVGMEMGPDGLYVTIPEKLAKYARERAAQVVEEETEEYKKYNSHEVTPTQIRKLGEKLLDIYGGRGGERAWKVVIDETSKKMSVVYESEGKLVREIRVGHEFRKPGIIDKLAILAHEIEGHYLRYANRDEQDFDIALLDTYSSGRTFVLSEAAAMNIEAQTKKEMVEMERTALPYYYIGIAKKAEGGSFKNCFRAVLENRAKRDGVTFQDLLNDDKEFDKKANSTFSSLLRLFRGHTPLDDDSGYIPKSNQLKYIEQELVVDTLKEAGLEDLLYINSVDFYSLEDLIALGMLDLSRVQRPRMVVAREIWPKIKEGLDRGDSLEEIIVGI